MKMMEKKGIRPKNDRGLTLSTGTHLTQNISSSINASFEGSDMTYDYDENGELQESGPARSAFYGGEIQNESAIEYMKKEGARGIKAIEFFIQLGPNDSHFFADVSIFYRYTFAWSQEKDLMTSS